MSAFFFLLHAKDLIEGYLFDFLTPIQCTNDYLLVEYKCGRVQFC